MTSLATVTTYEEARDHAIRTSTLNPALNPVIGVRYDRRTGRYEGDEYPQGHPLPPGVTIAARWHPTSTGRGRWERLEEPQD